MPQKCSKYIKLEANSSKYKTKSKVDSDMDVDGVHGNSVHAEI